MTRPLRVPVARLTRGDAALEPEAARYVARVRRLGPGDALLLFDPEAGLEADAEILAVDRGGGVRARIGEPRAAATIPARRVTLLQAIGKGDKLEAIVRDATELGATRVVPVIAERSLARPRADGERAQRWRRIAIEAARQCGRGDAPEVAPPQTLEAALAEFAPAVRGGGLGLCLHPESTVPLGARLRDLAPRAPVLVLVGPEGGLTESELRAAEAAGLSAVTLGPLVLRTETVCAAVLGAILASWSDAAP